MFLTVAFHQVLNSLVKGLFLKNYPDFHRFLKTERISFVDICSELHDPVMFLQHQNRNCRFKIDLRGCLPLTFFSPLFYASDTERVVFQRVSVDIITRKYLTMYIKEQITPSTF